MADSFVREWVCGKLQKAGFAVRISADARSALDALDREPDGIDIVPVVMLTGSITPATRRAAEAALFAVLPGCALR